MDSIKQKLRGGLLLLVKSKKEYKELKRKE